MLLVIMMIMSEHDWTGLRVVIIIKLSVGTATIGILRRLARKGLCFETHLNSGPIWSFKAVVASTPTTVISFGVKSKLMTVLALHFWAFPLFQSCHHLFLTSGPTVITTCHRLQTRGSKCYSRFCAFETQSFGNFLVGPSILWNLWSPPLQDKS